MSQNTKIQPTEGQRSKLAMLQKNFDLSDAELERCLYFSRDQELPWLPAEIQIKLAQMSDRFRVSDPDYITYVEALNQILYKATVIDAQGRAFSRIGVAAIGEKPGGFEIDTHALAQSRALNAALTDAQFNPFKAGWMTLVKVKSETRHPAFSGLPLSGQEKDLQQREDESTIRRRDLEQIHILAHEKGLNVKLSSGGWDKSQYRNWLEMHFHARSVVDFDEEKRAQVINKLKLYNDSYFEHLSPELEGEALIA